MATQYLVASPARRPSGGGLPWRTTIDTHPVKSKFHNAKRFSPRRGDVMCVWQRLRTLSKRGIL